MFTALRRWLSDNLTTEEDRLLNATYNQLSVLLATIQGWCTGAVVTANAAGANLAVARSMVNTVERRFIRQSVKGVLRVIRVDWKTSDDLPLGWVRVEIYASNSVIYELYCWLQSTILFTVMDLDTDQSGFPERDKPGDGKMTFSVGINGSLSELEAIHSRSRG